MTRRAQGIPDDLAAVEKLQGRCPGAHVLPHRTDRGQCTPVFCAGSAPRAPALVVDTLPDGSRFVTIGKKGTKERRTRKEALAIVSAEADKVIDALIPGDSPAMVAARQAAHQQKAEELVKLAHGIGRFAAMRAFLKVPEGLEGADAEQYVTQRSMALTVDALAEVERQLKLGDDSMRREAARDILDMTGLRKKEGVQGGGPVIMLVGQNGQGLPWMQRVPIGSSQLSTKAPGAVVDDAPLSGSKT